MKKNYAKLTVVSLTQQLDQKYWPKMDQRAIELANSGDCSLLLKCISKKLNLAGLKIKEAYGIVHNKDVIPIWDESEKKYVEQNKANHVHLLIKLEKGETLASLSQIMDIEPQYLEKLKSGRYGYENALAYLIHAKDEEKYQYSPDDVYTLKGIDFHEIYMLKKMDWEKGRVKKTKSDLNEDVDLIIDQILKGEISKAQILLTDRYYKTYAENKRKINEAFETLGEKKSFKTITDLDARKFKKSTIFLNAPSGSGKTKFSKELITEILKTAQENNEKWDFCMTAASNAFDEYNGQEILFLDDIRGESLAVSDWLKLLDPFTISPISARYHNKYGAARIIIITSTKSPIYFFQSVKSNIREDAGQFVRRIDQLINIDGDDFSISEPVKNTNQVTSIVSSFILDKKMVASKDVILQNIIKMLKKNNNWK